MNRCFFKKSLKNKSIFTEFVEKTFHYILFIPFIKRSAIDLLDPAS